MARRKATSPIEGRWRIVSMSEWDEEYLHEEGPAFIEFGPKATGEFHFGYVRGQMDCRATERNGKFAVEFTWDGHDETEHAFGRGWAVLKDDRLEGMIFFHFGDDSGFTAVGSGTADRQAGLEAGRDDC